MKTLLKNLLYTGLLGLAGTTLTMAAPVSGNPENKPTTSWVTSTDASFRMRTVHTQDNRISVHIQNPGLERLWLNLRTLDGEDVLHLPLPEHQVTHLIRLDLTHLTDGSYRVEVVSGINKVTAILSLVPADTFVPEFGATVPENGQ